MEKIKQCGRCSRQLTKKDFNKHADGKPYSLCIRCTALARQYIQTRIKPIGQKLILPSPEELLEKINGNLDLSQLSQPSDFSLDEAKKIAIAFITYKSAPYRMGYKQIHERFFSDIKRLPLVRLLQELKRVGEARMKLEAYWPTRKFRKGNIVLVKGKK